MVDVNRITVNVDLVIHSVAIDALRMKQLVRDRVDDPDEFVKRIKWFGVDSQEVLDDSKNEKVSGGRGWKCTIL